MKKRNLEIEVNHPVEELVQCRYRRCKRRGKFVNCYFAYEQCSFYQRWKAALDIYVKRSLQRQYLKNKKAREPS